MDRGKYIWMFGLNGCNKKGRKIGEFSVIVLKLSSKPRRLEVRLIYSKLCYIYVKFEWNYLNDKSLHTKYCSEW